MYCKEVSEDIQVFRKTEFFRHETKFRKLRFLIRILMPQNKILLILWSLLLNSRTVFCSYPVKPAYRGKQSSEFPLKGGDPPPKYQLTQVPADTRVEENSSHPPGITILKNTQPRGHGVHEEN